MPCNIKPSKEQHSLNTTLSCAPPLCCSAGRPGIPHCATVLSCRPTRCTALYHCAAPQADQVYRAVLQRHANHVKMVRMYALYLEGVKHDPWSAAHWSRWAGVLGVRGCTLDQVGRGGRGRTLVQVRWSMILF